MGKILFHLYSSLDISSSGALDEIVGFFVCDRIRLQISSMKQTVSACEGSKHLCDLILSILHADISRERAVAEVARGERNNAGCCQELQFLAAHSWKFS